ncbi:hypothetical protein KXD40_005242 [Peronospora effusa]|uniref:RxLR effector protein n=1 Tax=Peronospora effusa TaxID=542832 RepID=A0A3M6VUE5_9STRA|nr:hypothetical protein DD238_003519 [Peronospora effusa]UIZ22521.1 hypothetical protein KXD40_005242 [Peronospora effusa]CAI5702387.1 unnamed protein product [Peronospora effusa]
MVNFYHSLVPFRSAIAQFPVLKTSMRSCCFLLFVVVLVVFVVSVVFDTSLAMPRETESVDEPLKGVSSTVTPVDNITNRLLRVNIEAAGLLVMPAIDSVAVTKRWMPSIIQDIWVRLKMKILSIFHVKPENFKKMMQIDEKKYKQYYDRYFYQYYIKHLNAKLPEKYVDEIWNARLKYWLIKGLSVPQVADKLKGSKGIMAAGNTPSFDIIGRYNKMWGEEQVKLSSKQSGGG